MNVIKALQSTNVSYFDYKGYEWKVEVEIYNEIIKSLSEGATAFANNGLGDYLFLKDVSLNDSLPIVYEFWHDGPQILKSVEDFLTIIGLRVRNKSNIAVPKYESGDTMQIGDIVQYKGFLRKKTGEITYVPGVSKKDPNLEHDGINMALLKKENGMQVTLTIDPVRNIPCSYIKLLKRKP